MCHPSDVFIHDYTDGRGMCFDVSITNPLTTSALSRARPYDQPSAAAAIAIAAIALSKFVYIRPNVKPTVWITSLS